MLEFAPESKPTLHLWGKLIVHPANGLKQREKIKRLRKRLYIDNYMNHQFNVPPVSNRNLSSPSRDSRRVISVVGQASRVSPLRNKSMEFQDKKRNKQPLTYSFKVDKQRKRVVLSKFKFSNLHKPDRFRLSLTNNDKGYSLSPNRVNDSDSGSLLYKFAETNDLRTRYKSRLTPCPLMHEEKEYATIGVSTDL